MSRISLISKDTDLSNLSGPLPWDVVIDGRPYYVIKIDGYTHSIGGHWGENNLWAYPRDEKPSYKNLIQFRATFPVQWGLVVNPKLYTNYNGIVETNSNIMITRNEKPFCNVPGDVRYAIPKALTMIDEFKEHPADLNFIEFDKKIIGRKIWWRSQPSIIKRYIDEHACVVISPDACEFEIPKEFIDDIFMLEYYSADDIVTSILDKHIWWFR